MRIAFAHSAELMKSRLSGAETRVADIQRQISTGHRWDRISEDLASGLAVVSADRYAQRIAKHERILEQARGRLGLAEQTLADVGDLMNSARTLAVQGATDTLSQTQRDAIAEQIGLLRDRLVDLGNTQDARGSYIFSGQSLDTKPFREDAGSLVFDGDDLPQRVAAGPGRELDLTIANADSAFADAYAALTDLESHLRGGDTDLISRDDLAAIDEVSERFRLSRGRVGSSMQEAERLLEHHQRRQDELAAEISGHRDVDLAAALTDYATAQTAYQAALMASARGNDLSLMNFLR